MYKLYNIDYYINNIKTLNFQIPELEQTNLIINVYNYIKNINPNDILEIDEYDCKASHGAGVGAIDESDLFYLMSRGIERTEAVSLIVNGYIAPVLKQIDDENVIEYVMSIVKEKI